LDKELYAKALRCLARRDYAEAELFRRFSSDYDDDTIRTVIDELKRQNYQSDERYVEVFVRSAITKGRGPRRIINDFKVVKINSDLIDLYAMPNDIEFWIEQAASVYQKKYAESPANSQNEKAKRMRFMQYRGFDQRHFKNLLF